MKRDRHEERKRERHSGREKDNTLEDSSRSTPESKYIREISDLSTVVRSREYSR